MADSREQDSYKRRRISLLAERLKKEWSMEFERKKVRRYKREVAYLSTA
jgi:hypothetical protein